MLLSSPVWATFETLHSFNIAKVGKDLQYPNNTTKKTVNIL